MASMFPYPKHYVKRKVSILSNDSILGNIYALGMTKGINGGGYHWYLKEWREHFHLSGEALAVEMNTTKGTISKLERSQTFNTKWIKLYSKALSRIAGRPITARDLLRHPDAPPLDDLIEAATEADQKRARDIVRAFLNQN